MLLYSAAELKNCSDIALKALCENKENCHRRSILRALSSDECSTVPQDTCCNLCTRSCPYTELEYPASSLEVRKRKTRICSIPSQLQNAVREKLIAERDKFIQQDPSFRMVPKSVVCPLSAINDIASRVKTIHSVRDLQTFPGVRQQLLLPFFNALRLFSSS